MGIILYNLITRDDPFRSKYDQESKEERKEILDATRKMRFVLPFAFRRFKFYEEAKHLLLLILQKVYPVLTLVGSKEENQSEWNFVAQICETQSLRKSILLS
jgi:hypothetical protein